MKAAVITVSDKAHRGDRVDAGGPLLAGLLREAGIEVVGQTVVPDEPDQIARALAGFADSGSVDLVVTTGGTGIAPRDHTPEATRGIVGYEIPGIAELLRSEGYKKTPTAVLSRGVAGVRGRCLIVNLPGSPKAVREGMETLVPILTHALQMLRGENLEHDQAPRDGSRGGERA
jgi:molybdopterin adenylyltransferase